MQYALPASRKEELQWLQPRALIVGLAALVVCGVGAVFSPLSFFRAYLAAYLFFLSIAHGCLVILMIYYLTGGAWGFLIRKSLESGMRTLPLLAVLFIPVACGVHYLYLWADPEIVAANPELQHKQVYLNVPFFLARAALYFVLWLGLTYFLSAWSAAEDRTGDRVFSRRLTRVSGPGLVIYGITTFFASIDWLMSLQPAFRSTIFGPLFASGELLAGFACAVLVAAWLVVRPPLDKVVSEEALNDLGSLLFAFVVVWSYLAFFQYLLIWIGNLRYDIIWYLPRLQGGWRYVTYSLVVFQFVIPFFLLLMRPVKRNPRLLAAVSCLLLFTQLLTMYHQVLPAFEPDAILAHWIDLVTPFAVGGLWLAYFCWDLQRHPALPSHDANEQAALHLRALDAAEHAAEEAVHG